MRRLMFVAVGSATALATVAAPGARMADAEPRSSGACGEVSQLTNASFESPVLGGNFALMLQENVPGWSTTASDGRIELWRSGFNGVPSAEGVQHAELNANQPSTLFQDVATTPGTAMAWRLSHRGRDGTDTMRLLIGPPGGTLIEQATMSDGNTAWGAYRGAYTVPAGQTVTRFAFQSISSASSSPSNGNFLDAIAFGTFPCLVAVKSVDDLNGGDVEVGDVLTYEVDVDNQGGMPALSTTLVDPIPAGASYVAGSMNVIVGEPLGAQTDGDGDDAGTLLAGPDRVQFQLRSAGQSTAAIMPGGEVAVSWSVRVLPAAAGTEISNIGTVSLLDLTTFQPTSISTNQVTVDVAAAADLLLAKSPALAGVAPGGQYTTTFTVTNAGPSAASGVVVTDTLAPSETFVSSPDGCTAVDATVMCPIGELAAAATTSRQIVVSIASALVDGTVLADQATVSADQEELVPRDNVANAIAVVTVQPAVDTDVAVDIVSGPPVPLAGAPAAAIVDVVNTGPGVADDVVLTITGMLGTPISSATSDLGPCAVSGSTATCSLGTLQPGSRVRAVASGRIDVGVADGTLAQLRAEVTTSSLERTVTNNVDIASRAVVAPADVAVAIDARPDRSVAGSSVRFPLAVTNVGPALARAVTLTVQLPAALSVDDAGGCVLVDLVATCAVGDLEPGTVVRLALAGTIGPGASGTLPVSVEAMTTSPDPIAGNNADAAAMSVDPLADLRVTKTAQPSTVVRGRPVTFVVSVVNQGPSVATGVVVVDIIPAGVQGAGVTVSAGAYDVTVNRWTIGTLGPAQAVSLTMTGIAGTAGTAANYADVSADQFDPVPDDNTAFATVTVVTALPPTGNGGERSLLTVGAAVVAGGVALVAITKRRRTN